MHPTTIDERRTHQRIKPPFPLFVDCPMPKKVRDISLGGAYIEDSDPLPTGHKLHLLFKHQKPSPVALRGVIRRAELRRGMGVEFAETAPERSNHLKKLLRTFSQGPAAASAETVWSAAAASAGSADAASAADTVEAGLGEIPAILDDGYRPPPPPEPEEETEQLSPTPESSHTLFYAIVMAVFICAFALGLAYFHYSGQARSAPAAAATPPPTAEPTAQPPAAVAGMAQAQPSASAEPGEPVAETSAPTATTRARFAVQVGAYEERSKSEALARTVSTFYQGPVVVAPAQVRGKTYYRVQLPVGTREEAKQLAARLAEQQKIEAWVRPLP
jgi:cell division septation protein DedD